MKKWVITGLALAGLVTLWLSFHWWLSNIFPFLKTYKDEIDTAMKILTPVGTVAAYLVGQWVDDKKKEKPISSQNITQTASGEGSNVGGSVNPGKDYVGHDQITIIHQAPAAVQPSTSLHQLPPPPADFTGRSDELRELMEAVGTSGLTISGLHGLGGVGKTALALKLADRLKANYPDAQFYLDLKGVSKEPLTPKAAMGHVVRAYLPDAKLPDSEADLAGLYRSVLHEKKALLLMDNARDARQVEQLIPPATCLLLVTSRQHFTLPGLFPKNLDELTPLDAWALLIRIAPRLAQEKQDCVSELARLCGYLPLALRTVASTLATRITESPSRYVQKLADARERLNLTATDASLKLSYDLLADDLTKRFRALAVFPDTFDAAGAAAVWEAESHVAEEALGQLYSYSLLEFNPASARYRLHDLVRAFADAWLDDCERNLARLRHAKHYKNVLANSATLYQEGGESVNNGLTLCDLEFGNIQAGQSWATTHASEDKAAAQLCSEYPNAGVYCLELRLRPREFIEWLRAGLAAARQSKDRKAESAHLGNLGIAYGSLGEYDQAIDYFNQNLEIVREIGDRRSEGNSLANLGVAYDYLGEHARAIEFYKRRLQISQEIGDRHGEGSAMGNLGNAYLHLGDSSRAIDCGLQNLKISREIGNRRSEGIALGNLGSAFSVQGDNKRALDHHDQSLQIAREIGDRRGEGTGLWNMSLAFEHLGDRAKAVANAEAALKILDQIEDPLVVKIRKRLADWRGNA